MAGSCVRVELSLAPACRHYSLLDKRKLQREFGDGIPGVVTSQLRQRVYDEERREAERKPPATRKKHAAISDSIRSSKTNRLWM